MSLPGFPRRQKSVVTDGGRGYRLHELDVGGHREVLCGSPEEAERVRARLAVAIHRFTHSVAGRGRRFTVEDGSPSTRITRVA